MSRWLSVRTADFGSSVSPMLRSEVHPRHRYQWLVTDGWENCQAASLRLTETLGRRPVLGLPAGCSDLQARNLEVLPQKAEWHSP